MTTEGSNAITDLTGNPAPSPLIDADEPPEVIRPAPAADEQKTEPETTDETVDPKETQEEETRKQSRRQRKLERERDARVRAETRAEIAERELARVRTVQPTAEAEPSRDQFEDYESYLDARTEFRAKKTAQETLKAEREAQERTTSQTREQTEHQKQAEDWAKREKEYIAKNPDFEERVNPFVEGDLQEFSREARMLMVELGPEILDHLAQNPDVVDDIIKLSPLRQVAALGKIDLSAPDKGDETKKREPAPAPAKHVRQGSTAPASLSDDMGAYIEQRRKQGARWAR